MKRTVHELVFTTEELLLIRDALTEEYQRMRHFRDERGVNASEECKRRTALLQGLKETFQSRCMRAR